MTQIFKALATINAWTLFIIGWISLIVGYLHLAVIYLGIPFIEMPADCPPVWMPLIGGFICLALSVVVMKLRLTMA